MNHYVHTASLPYALYLQQDGTSDIAEVHLSSRESLLLGTPPTTPPRVLAPPPAKPAPPPAATAPTAAETPTGSTPPLPPAKPTAAELPIPSGFHWAHCDQLIDVGRFATSLADLKHTAKSTAEMWAFERFDVAREAFRHGLAAEALTHVQHALAGADNHEGYRLEYRLHFLQGLIQLGSRRHRDPATLNLAEATQAFATAARCAQPTDPTEAGWSFLAAAWASYCQGNMAQALLFLPQAATLLPRLGEVHFLSAKVHFHLRQTGPALTSLALAIGLDPGYSLAALRDGDFLPFADDVMQLLENERHVVGQRASQALQKISERIAQLTTHPATDAHAAAPPASEELDAALALVQAARDHFGDATLFGYLTAEALTERASGALHLALARSQKVRSLAEDALHTARDAAAEATSLQIAPYRFGVAALKELNRARSLLEEAEVAFRANTLPGHIETERLAHRAVQSLHLAIEAYKTSAIEQATAELAHLEHHPLVPAARSASGQDGGSIKTWAAFGALIGLLPGAYAGFSSFHGGSSRWPDAILRLSLSIAAASALGALVGILIAPLFSSSGIDHQRQLTAQRRAALDHTIARLRGLALNQRSLPR